MKVAAVLASIAAARSLAATLIAIAATLMLAACDLPVADGDLGTEPVALSVLTGEEWAPPRGTGGQGDAGQVAANTCSFLERMEALMRNLSTCWMRDSYVLIVMDIVCPMNSSDDLRRDIEGKLHTLVTCYGLEVLEADGSLWYRWPDPEARQAAIDAAVALGAGRR